MEQALRILLIGSGGREHALAWRLAQSPSCAALFCAPGNPGIAAHATCVPIGADDFSGLVAFAKKESIDLVFPGPEAPLVHGLADTMTAEGIAVFGPCAQAARLEGSKGFTKDFCSRHGIPTAPYGRFSDIGEAQDFIRTMQTPIVIKADGLAAGKGVVICPDQDAAMAAVAESLSGAAFGTAGRSVVIEAFLRGEEISYFALCDGKTVIPFGSAQDHKRVGDGDTGPNTGGMGAFSPARAALMTPQLETDILDQIIHPTAAGMAAEGYPFRGVLFAGLMIQDGMPFLIEYNVRFGDPECQAMMMRFHGDLAAVFRAGAQGNLDTVAEHVRASWSPDPALCVVMAAQGYPSSYVRGTRIGNLDRADSMTGIRIFHAGTRQAEDGTLLSDGGRVLGVTAAAPDMAQARARAYAAIDQIDWPTGFYRKDIGARAL